MKSFFSYILDAFIAPAQRIVGHMGEQGGIVIGDNATSMTAPQGHYCGFLTITQTVVATMDGNVTDVTTQTYPSNFLIPGVYRTITLTSGDGIALYAHANGN